MSRCLWLDRLLMVLIILAFLLCLILPVHGAFSEDQQCATSSPSHLRIHFFANSNSAYDQLVKQMVRDEVMNEIGSTLIKAYAVNPDYALSLLKASDDTILRIAQQTAASAGYDGSITVKAGHMELPARSSGSLISPAGQYMALVVTIGKGEGKNWWGLLYPDLVKQLSDSKGHDNENVSWDSKRIFLNWFTPHH